MRERRNQLTHPRYPKPELVATAPNQTWSWDITRLLGPKRWTYFYLYVVLDIFSRYVVGWMVAERESAALAARLIEQTCLKHDIEPQTLTLHSDRGAPMTSKCTAQLLADLGVTRSLSRPQVSDDNPFSEAQFKTLKYHPGFPGRFPDIAAAIAFCRSFFPWYNTEHRHGGIAMLTPGDVHHGRAQRILEQRERTLRAAWAQHPAAIRSRTTEAPASSQRGLDQPTRRGDDDADCSVNPNRQVESTTGAVAVGRWGVAVSGGFRDAGASVHAMAPFPVAAHRTGRADFPHPALGRDHAFAHGRLALRCARWVRPRSLHRSSSGKRTNFPDRILCFRHSHRRSRWVACRSTAA